MISYLKCPNCNGIISANDNDKIVQCATCGKKYVNPNFHDVNLSHAANAGQDVKCKVCGKNVSKEYEFCPFCGAQLKVRCSKCGNALREEDLFCPRCGTLKNKPVQNVSVESVESVETQEPCDNHVDAPIIVEDAAPKTENDVFKFAEAVESKPVSVAANNRPHKKYGKKAVQAVVKNAICLVLAIMLFAFAFCPIIKIYSFSYRSEGIGLSGVDYIAIMGATTKKYNSEDDAAKLEKLEKELDDLNDDLEKCDSSSRKKANGEIVMNAEYKKIAHKYYVESRKYSASKENNFDTVTVQNYIATGILSLVYILVSGATMVISGIALVLSIINLKRADDKKLRYWSGYPGLFVMLLFLSIAIVFLLTLFGTSDLSVIAITLIFRLLFECIAVAFVMVDLCTAQDKAERRQGVFKAAAIVLCVIIAGVCFAPSFKTTINIENTYTDGTTHVVKYDFEAQDTAWVFGITQIGKAEYDRSYKDIEHERYLESVKSAISYNGNYVAGNVVELVYFDKFTYNDAKELANGYYLLLAVIAMVGLCGCLSAMSGKVIDVIRKVAQPLLVLLVVAVLVVGAVMVKTVNEYMSTNDISNFKMAMDCGIILALVFSIALCVCEYVPAMIEKGKSKAKPMQA